LLQVVRRWLELWLAGFMRVFCTRGAHDQTWVFCGRRYERSDFLFVAIPTPVAQSLLGFVDKTNGEPHKPMLAARGVEASRRQRAGRANLRSEVSCTASPHPPARNRVGWPKPRAASATEWLPLRIRRHL